MAQLFGVGVPAISKHLKNIFDEGELVADSVIPKMETTAADNKIYETSFYSLDAIIAVGYRVNSLKAARFRQWATKILNEYIRKGFAMDDERLKQELQSSEKTISGNCWSGFVPFGQVNGASGSRSRTSMRSAAQTMTATPPPLATSMR